MVDACGQHRHSGFHYKWAALSVLNNDPPLDCPGSSCLDQYMTCFHAISAAVHEVYPELKTMGPEQWARFPSLENYEQHFLNGSNHKDGKPPQLLSVHHVSHQVMHFHDETATLVLFQLMEMITQDTLYESWFGAVDDWMEQTGRPLERMRAQLAPETEMYFVRATVLLAAVAKA